MKILYILGNGFDLNLGLATRFSDFNEHYLTQKNSNPSVELLKSTIKKDFETWADLEIALGEFTKQLKSAEEFDIIFEDILVNLSSYLKMQESKFDLSEVDTAAIYSSLVKPELYLTNTERIEIQQFKDQFRSNDWELNLATFNYTRILEKFIDIGDNIMNNRYGKEVVVNSILHVHGYTDKRMILGVNDRSQISNSTFQEDIDICESIVKPECNRIYRFNNDNELERYIKEANLICVFGSSLGATDKIWWERIGTRLRNNKIKLVLFVRNKQINPLLGFRNGRTERNIKEVFLSSTEIVNDLKEGIYPKIHVGVNTQLFNEERE